MLNPCCFDTDSEGYVCVSAVKGCQEGGSWAWHAWYVCVPCVPSNGGFPGWSTLSCRGRLQSPENLAWSIGGWKELNKKRILTIKKSWFFVMMFCDLVVIQKIPYMRISAGWGVGHTSSHVVLRVLGPFLVILGCQSLRLQCCLGSGVAGDPCLQAHATC